MSEDLMKLAERVEAATGPDRELDAMIAVAVAFVAVGSNPPSARALHKDHGGNNSYEDIGKHWPRLPAYTASLDTAITLVPDIDEWRPLLDATDSGESNFYAELFPGDDRPTAKGHAQSLPLALCAAALRARAQGSSQ